MTLIELHEQKAGADSCRVLAATFLLPVAMAGEDLDRCVWLGSWFVMAKSISAIAVWILYKVCHNGISFPCVEALKLPASYRLNLLHIDFQNPGNGVHYVQAQDR